MVRLLANRRLKATRHAAQAVAINGSAFLLRTQVFPGLMIERPGYGLFLPVVLEQYPTPTSRSMADLPWGHGSTFSEKRYGDFIRPN